MKIAVIHDWLVTYGGADRVLEQILTCYPEADLFSVVDFLPATQRRFIFDKPVQTSFIQRLPFARNSFRNYLALMPLAVEQFDLSSYDMVISNSHSVAKGVITSSDQLHICYCHTPMRYAWDLQNQYLEESGMSQDVRGWIARWMLKNLRAWDVQTANRVDEFVCNSEFISRRVRKIYRRNSRVIYPPVDISSFGLQRDKDDYYVTVSRLVPYKRVRVIVEAFNRMPDKRLVVIGQGPGFAGIKSVARNNVAMLGFQDSGVVCEYMQRAKAFVFAAEEDFGICVAEAQACGTPVIALGRGGVREIVRDLSSDQPTGILFWQQTPEAIIESVETFERELKRFEPESCRDNVFRFAPKRFREQFRTFCDESLAETSSQCKNPFNRELLAERAAQLR